MPPTGPPETEQGPATIASEAERAPISRRRAYAYRAVGIVAVALAAVGALLPLMPTTVFLLIALWAFARGSPAWADRLRAHLLRRKGDTGPAREAFTRYLERAPDAPDAPMIRHYVNTL